MYALGPTSVAILVGIVLALVSSLARADDAEPASTTLTYTTPQQKHYLRATLELTALMVAGSVQYATEQGNATDWDLGYDWPSFRAKLSGEAVRFDTNRFDTNMITHPAAGLAYYLAARGNRLNVLESLLLAAAASTTWEYVGEFREKASANDLAVTPVSGMVLGEAFTQLGVLFERSRPTPVTKALAFVLAPSKEIHDWIDDARPRRSNELDDFGLSRDEAHRFELSAGGVATTQDKGPTSGDARIALRTEVIDAIGWNLPGRRAEWLTDGNVSQIAFETQLGRAGLADLQLDVVVAPLSWATRDLALGEQGLTGQRLLLGLTAGFDYGVHRYDRTNPDEMDQVSGIHVGGLLLRHDAFAPPVHVRTTLALRPTFAAVRAIAVDEYFRRFGASTTDVPTVLNQESYYFAFGANLSPEVEVTAGPVSLGALARLDSYYSIEGLDRYQERIVNEIALHDRRALGRAWLGVSPAPWATLRVGVDRRIRNGQVGTVSAGRSEDALWASAGTVF